MDLLLTPLVTRLLKQYVKRSSEGAGRDLKVSFSRGNVLTLHNLELDLAPLLGGAASLAHVRRAFARRLSITIPWTALTTQPIQVVLDTVELVLSAAEHTPAPTPSASASGLSEPGGSRQALASAAEEEAAAGGGGWFGSTLQTMALRAGLHVTVKLTNVVAKWVEEGQFVAAATFQELLMQTSAGDWAQGLQNPDAWLKKECTIRQLSISLDQHMLAAGTHSYQPLLRIPSLTASALLPVFAWLEGADLAGDPFNTSVQVQLAPITVAVNDRQLRWAGSLVALVQAAAAAKQAAEAAEVAEEAAAAQEAAEETTAAAVEAGTPRKLPAHAAFGSPAIPALLQPVAVGGPSPSPSGMAAAGLPPAVRPQTKALGVFGRVWDFLIDEAGYVETAEGSSPTAEQRLHGGSPGAQTGTQTPAQRVPAALPAMPMFAELQVVLEGLQVALGMVVVREEPLPPLPQQPQDTALAAAAQHAAGGGQTPQQVQQAQQADDMAPDLADTLRALREARSSNSLEAVAALQQQLAAALAAADAGGVAVAAAQRGQGHLPAHEVHQCAELSLQRLQVAVASRDASISGVAVELQQLTLRRSTAAAPLLTHVLAPGTAGTAGTAGPDSEQRGTELGALAAAAAAAGSSSWVEVLCLEAPLAPAGTPPSPAASKQLMQQQQPAVSVHFFDTAAGPSAAGAASGTAATAAPGQLRCSVSLGRLLLAHAPGFATNLLLLARQYEGGTALAVLPDGIPAAPPATPTKQAAATRAAAASPFPDAVSPAGGSNIGANGANGTNPSVLAQAMQPQLLLECRVGQVDLALLSSQAADATALVLALRQLELRSGPLNWEAPWSSRLRRTLLAPAQGFKGHGLRLSLGAAELAVADSACSSSDSGGLWQLRRASAVSNVVVLDAVVALAETRPGSVVPPASADRKSVV